MYYVFIKCNIFIIDIVQKNEYCFLKYHHLKKLVMSVNKTKYNKKKTFLSG